jgi:hypothetical protein
MLHAPKRPSVDHFRLVVSNSPRKHYGDAAGDCEPKRNQSRNAGASAAIAMLFIIGVLIKCIWWIVGALAEVAARRPTTRMGPQWRRSRRLRTGGRTLMRYVDAGVATG